MRQFIELNLDDQQVVIQNAMMFSFMHKRHVRVLTHKEENAVAPSGSDMFKPELWKGIHWKWYFNRFETDTIKMVRV